MGDEAIHQPHDTLVRTILRRRASAEAFLRAQLGRLHPGLAGDLDWAGLRQPAGAFVDGAMRGLHTDLVYEIPFRVEVGRALPLHCLVEHQSQADPRMALRMLGYMTAFLNHWRGQHPQERRLPPLVLMVFYTGRSPWRAPTRLRDLFCVPQGTRLALHLPDLPYLLETLSGQEAAEAVGDAVLAAMMSLMYATERGRGEDWLDRHGAMLKALDRELDGEALGRLFSLYLLNASGEADYSTILGKLAKLQSRYITGGSMTAAEQLIQLGEQRGVEKGRQEGLQEGLIGKIHLCQRILGQEPTPGETLWGYSLDKLEDLAQRLEQQVLAAR